MELSVRIIPNDHGGFTAICLTLPGCMSKGRTRQEAQQNIREAICGYFAAVNNFVPANLSADFIEAATE